MRSVGTEASDSGLPNSDAAPGGDGAARNAPMRHEHRAAGLDIGLRDFAFHLHVPFRQHEGVENEAGMGIAPGLHMAALRPHNAPVHQKIPATTHRRPLYDPMNLYVPLGHHLGALFDIPVDGHRTRVVDVPGLKAYGPGDVEHIVDHDLPPVLTDTALTFGIELTAPGVVGVLSGAQGNDAGRLWIHRPAIHIHARNTRHGRMNNGDQLVGRHDGIPARRR